MVYCKKKLARLDSMELGLENIIHDTDIDEEDIENPNRSGLIK